MERLLKEMKSRRDYLNEIIQSVCEEFDVTASEIREAPGRQENLLRLVALSLADELIGLPPRFTARMRLDKYLEFIPGLKSKYEALRKKLQKRLTYP